jgi:hypothetical protein
MRELTIQLTKRTDGSVIMRCLRADGSVTWQRQHGPDARFFPLHDLTHFAVETTMEFRRGFFGLLADGWKLTDFTGPKERGPIPPEAQPAELIVGLIDAERAAGEEPTADEINEHARTFYAQRGLTDPPPTITDQQLRRILDLTSELFARWRAMKPNHPMELIFDRGDFGRS